MPISRTLTVFLVLLATLAPASVSARSRHRVRHDPGYPAKVPIRRLDGRLLKPAEIDSTVERLMRQADVTGLGIALLHGGHVAYMKAYGWRDREAGLPLTENTLMSGASLTKGVVARAAVQLARAGTLPLDRPLAEVLPALRTGTGAFGELAAEPRAARLTPRLLLTHTSGLANLRADEPDRLMRLHFEPGSRFAYSGAGFELLQAAMESAAGDSLQNVVSHLVFAPLGMWHSSLVWSPRFEGDVAQGYDEDGSALGFPRWEAPDAAGSLVTTLADFSRLLASLLGGSEFATSLNDTLFAREIEIGSAHEFPTLDSLESPLTRAAGLGYGLGWGLLSTPRGEAFFKEGHGAGWRHYAVGFRDTGDGLVIMSNSANAEGAFVPLLEQVLGDPWTPAAWEGFTRWDQRRPRPRREAWAQRDTLAADALAPLAGTYRLPPDVSIVVRAAAAHLTLQENGEPPQDLWPFGPSRGRDFRSVQADDRWTFETDSTGVARTLVLHLGQRDLRLARVP